MPLLWISVAFLAGILAGDRLDASRWLWFALAGIFLFLAILDSRLAQKITFWGATRRTLPVSVGLLLFFVCLGGLRVSWTQTSAWQASDLAYYNNKGEFILTGWVAAAPDRRDDRTYYQIETIELTDLSNPDWTRASLRINGRMRVSMDADAPWEYSDLLRFTARPELPAEDGDFSYRQYLAGMNIHSVAYHPQGVERVGGGFGSRLSAALIRFRQKAREIIFATFPQPESGLLAGILLGMDNDLPDALAQAYRDTGVAHIIAISGFNMAILAGLFLRLFTRQTGPYWAALMTAVLLVFYSLFVEASPSVWRALIMAVMGAGGHLIGRRQHGANALCFTAAAMCLVKPLLLWDVSFQLSFAATFGLVVFAQPLQNWLCGLLEKRVSEKTAVTLTGPLSDYFLFTLAAQFATLPVIAWHFGRVSFSSILANPIVLPLQPALLISGGLTVLAGMLHPLAGKVLMFFSWPLMKFTNSAVTLLAKIKGGALSIHPSMAVWILIAVILFLLVFLFRAQIKKHFKIGRLMWLVVFLLAGCFTTISIYFNGPDGNLHLHLARCEDQSTFFLHSPGGKVVILDPRGDVNELASALEAHLSPWNYAVDAVLLTDRGSGQELAELAERIQVKSVILTPAVYRQEGGASALVIPAGIEVLKMLPGQAVEVEPGLILAIAGEDLNGTALWLEYGATRLLLPNGVDYARIKAASPASMQNLTALALGVEDTDYIPIRVWRQINPGLILWREVAISPFAESLGVDTRMEVILESDGESAWLVE